jgi:ABC-type glycerol-3-phosphate transport system permease component
VVVYLAGLQDVPKDLYEAADVDGANWWTMIPLFLLFRTFGWVNTYLPLTVPAFFGNAFFIFLFRQFYLGLPAELSDAARIDGCNDLGIYWRIILPLSRPVLAAWRSPVRRRKALTATDSTGSPSPTATRSN